MIQLTDEGSRTLSAIAARHRISESAAEHLLMAVASGHGHQAQFNHPELGGLGQWSSGGMTMIGDMFNGDLKNKVANICAELAQLSGNTELWQPRASPSGSPGQQGGSDVLSQSMAAANWWPDHLGGASSVGAQNDLRYAVFPSTRKLAISLRGQIKIYDTADHQIMGVSQQQGEGQSVTFVSQHGLVRLAELREVAAPQHSDPKASGRSPGRSGEPGHSAPKEEPARGSEPDIFERIERLADLHARGILQDAEFQAKKRELLDRL